MKMNLIRLFFFKIQVGGDGDRCKSYPERRDMKPLKLLPGLVFFLTLAFTCLSFAEMSSTYAIVDCTIIPVKGSQVDNGVIIIRNGLIEAIDPKENIPIPEEAEIVDAKGLFAYPGLIDGKETDLSSVYTELLEKYKKRID
jgi:hypothetical protein